MQMNLVVLRVRLLPSGISLGLEYHTALIAKAQPPVLKHGPRSRTHGRVNGP